MKKSQLSRVLIAAGLLAAGAAVQAQTFDSPTQAGEASTMTNGAPNLLTTNSPFPDGTAVTTTLVSPGYSYYSYSTAPVVSYSYTYPAVPSLPYSYSYVTPTYAPSYAWATPNTSDIPLRAGEASTYTNGVPNLLASNSRYYGPFMY
jgi:hypothetical protein